ncbi:predicted protein [Uncinocarpus reesii 1704]|uniref:Uncharacterized protein n=1 Tax=Uncinocarpus reesii (strain UAMH 1704) TaxID=336963 RepID=C4JS55_UNCRE|nr:uncharacterized protein UREG_05294 [Uncinocarpus reesii 1704]EEP80452.1 predicted protein [Uncinocarpus reesii 1704]
MVELSKEKVAKLQKYSACDFLSRLPWPVSPETPASIIAPISTVQFISKSDALPQIAQDDPEHHGFPEGTHWVDHTQRDTIVLLDQPEDQKCAILGGIMSARMSAIGAKAALVNGRVRDMAELRAVGLPVRITIRVKE